MDTRSWYRALNKPSWAPEEWVFGTVWSILYPIIFAVNLYIVMMLVRGKIGLNVAVPFWLNLFFNIIFTPIQFGLRNNTLACVDIVLILLTIIWSMVEIWSYNKFISLAYIPYLIWVGIATVLQIQITLLNR